MANRFIEYSVDKPQLFLYLDVETTGLNSKTCGLIEVAGVFEIGGIIIHEFELLINPYSYPREVEVQEKALAVNNRTIPEIQTFLDQKVAFDYLLQCIEHFENQYRCNNPIIIGYNVNFDVEFIQEWFVVNNIKYASYFNYKYIDVYQLVLNMAYLGIFDIGPNSLKDMCLKLDIDLTNAHTAIADIKATRDLHRKLIGYMQLVNLVNPQENISIIKNINHWGSKKICDKLGIEQTDFKKELLNG
jgi:DNA polymerase-3 subunit epsilon